MACEAIRASQGDGRARCAAHRHGKAWVSLDYGTSWDAGTTIDAGPFAYSVPVEIAPDEIGILWKADLTGAIRFTRLPIRSPS